MHNDARCPLVNASAATSSAGATSVPARNLGKAPPPRDDDVARPQRRHERNLASAHANTERPPGAAPVVNEVVAPVVVDEVVLVVVRGYTFAKARPQRSRR